MIIKTEQAFSPATISITCETAEELLFLLATVNTPLGARQDSYKSKDPSLKFNGDYIDIPLYSAVDKLASERGLV